MSQVWWHSNGAPDQTDAPCGVLDLIGNLERPCFVVANGAGPVLTAEGEIVGKDVKDARPCLGIVPGLSPRRLGDPSFQEMYGTSYCYMAGAMAQGISSVEMTVALGKNGFLGSFGSGGLGISDIEDAVIAVKAALPQGPFAFNLLFSPYAPDYEKSIVDLYLKHGVRTVEASAYITPSPFLVYYRAAGMTRRSDGAYHAENRVLAKLSRREVMEKFLEPPPAGILGQLVAARLITSEQAEAAAKRPLADDITVEADSAGHTDNRPLISLLPALLAVRDQLQRKFNYERKVRIGAAGGISTPESALAAFMMGADYIVTGSVNQSCVEAGTSEQTRTLLAQAGMADIAMAPAADMFEMGARVQVLKKGTMFPFISQKLYDLYRQCGDIRDIPADERDRLERKVFRKNLNAVWEETVDYFRTRDPKVVENAGNNPKKKMALLFKWYLGQSSRWAITGASDRAMDAQVWCGQAMGAFNDWAAGSRLEKPAHRRVADIASLLMHGAAMLCRLQFLKMLQFPLKPSDERVRPEDIPGPRLQASEK